MGKLLSNGQQKHTQKPQKNNSQKQKLSGIILVRNGENCGI